MEKTRRYQNWDEVFKNPCNIRIEPLNTGYITGMKEGMLSTRSEAYQDQCSYRYAKLPVLSHLVAHNDRHVLIDTGFDSSFSKRTGGTFKGILRPLYFRNRYKPVASLGIDKQLEAKGIKPDTIYLTHAHEHSVGLSAFDDAIDLVIGKGEHDINFFPLVYSTEIKSRKSIQELDFGADGVEMPLLGSCVDLFGDGSFWAVDTHGHTKGHISYLINGNDRVVLLTGDVSITALGFSIGVETGKYSENAAETKVSFDKLKKFAEHYPHVEIIFGHEVTGRFDIEYLK